MIFTIRRLIFLFVLLPFAVGCGGGTDDDMMARGKAVAEARRAEREADAKLESSKANVAAPPNSDVSTDSEKPAPGPGNKLAAKEPAGAETPATAATATPADRGHDAESPVLSTELRPDPVDQRKPATALSSEQQDAKLMENLRLLGAACAKHNEKTVDFMDLTAPSGRPLLSWRVRILPALGYQELYNAFRLDEPWDSPHNMTLLPRIPDVFVSPQRWDANTNLMAIRGRFTSGSRVWSTNDGLPTLSIVEVNDSLAIPWTQPGDYEVAYEMSKHGIGKLHPQGTYALTFLGESYLIPNELSDQELYFMCRFEESKDLAKLGLKFPPSRLPSSAIAATRNQADAAMVGQADTPSSADGFGNASANAGIQTRAADNSATSSVASTDVRSPVPSPDLIRQSSDKLRDMFGKQIGEAKSPKERIAVGRLLLEHAERVQEDVAGQYALLQAVLNLGCSNGDLSLALAAIAKLQARFDLPAGELELDAVRRFRSVAYAPHNDIEIQGFGKLAASAMQRAIVNGDYTSAALCSNLMEKMIRLGDRSMTLETVEQLDKFNTIANNKHKSTMLSVEVLSKNPTDPEAAAIVGGYFCFVRGSWDEGVRLLRLASDNQISRTAIADSSASATRDPQTMIQAGNAWWDLSEASKDPLVSEYGRGRAIYWYKEAVPMLGETLDRLHATSRLNQYGNRPLDSSLVEKIERIASLRSQEATRFPIAGNNDRNRQPGVPSQDGNFGNPTNPPAAGLDGRSAEQMARIRRIEDGG
ncbi:MAG: DUF1559 domain-containing protein [Pirellulaceae bacterium]